MEDKDLKIVEEAIKKGYNNGTIILYENANIEEVIGDGEFDIIKEKSEKKLIKYERTLTKTEKENNLDDRRYDTVWSSKNGWTKIIEN